MRRPIEILMLVLAVVVAILLAGAFRSIATSDTTGIVDAAKPVKHVFCQSLVMITLPERRVITNVYHTDGGTAAVEESLRRLPNPDIPPTVAIEVVLANYQVQHTVCFKSWAGLLELTDQLSFGSASRKLDDPYLITERDMRRAILKIYIKEGWEIAETMFPLQREQ